VLEGVAFGLRDALELMRAAGLAAPEEIRVTGGGSRSRLWRQILADVLGAPVLTTSTAEGAAQGAAMLAAVGCGRFADVPAACRDLVELGDPIVPSPAAATYDGAYERYRELYPALAPTFHGLG
jgi:xylulokinase